MGGIPVNSNNLPFMGTAPPGGGLPGGPPPNPADLARMATQRDAERLMVGAADGTLNSRELVALGNYRQGTQEMVDRFGPGPLSTDQNRQLLNRVTGFNDTLMQYRTGEFSPTTPADAPLQTPQDVFRSVPGGSDANAEQLRNSNTPWDGYARMQYRMRSAPEAVQDPRKFNAIGAPPPANPELTQTVNENFASWDLNRDGSLSREELTQNMTNPKFHGREAAALTTLKRNYEALSKLAPEEGISRSDWDTFSQGDFSSETIGRTSAMYQGLNAHQPGKTGALKDESFDPLKIHQNLDGSCVLLSTMQGMKPEQLRSMIHDDGNGQYTVKFADGRSVQVPEPTDAQRMYYSQAGDGERWPAIFELGTRQLLSENNPNFAREGIDHRDAMMLMTGRPAEMVDTAAVGYPEFRRRLEGATTAGGPVIAGTPEPGQPGEALHNGLVPNHEYAVLGFNPQTNQVTLRNPHAHGEYRGPRDGKDDGTFQMPADEFYASFQHIGFPRDPNAPVAPPQIGPFGPVPPPFGGPMPIPNFGFGPLGGFQAP